MITLCFPLFQSDQSMHLRDSNSLVSLTEDSYSGKTLAAWVNNSVLEGAETDLWFLCFPTALQLPLRRYVTCVLGMRVEAVMGERRGDTSAAAYRFSMLCLLSLTSTSCRIARSISGQKTVWNWHFSVFSRKSSVSLLNFAHMCFRL